MNRFLRTALIVIGVLIVILLIGPFLVPVPPLKDTVPPGELADTDSRFVEVNGLDVHYKATGEGKPTFVLLHGFAASTFSWREVMEPLGEIGTVIAFDRPAFGLTERPMRGEWDEQNPYSPEAQVELTVGIMDQLGVEKAILVGNSAGGTVSMNVALAYPERVTALILVDPAVYTGGHSPGWIRPILNTPQVRRLGPLVVRRIQNWGIEFGRSAWHDPDHITPEIWEGYKLPLQAENWDRALWEMTLASHGTGLPERLNEFTLPVLVVTGDDDRIVPTEDSIRLAGELPDAELTVIAACGHIPHEECPEEFLQAVYDFLEKLGY